MLRQPACAAPALMRCLWPVGLWPVGLWPVACGPWAVGRDVAGRQVSRAAHTALTPTPTTLACAAHEALTMTPLLWLACAAHEALGVGDDRVDARAVGGRGRERALEFARLEQQ